jgi:hypothetical protein
MILIYSQESRQTGRGVEWTVLQNKPQTGLNPRERQASSCRERGARSAGRLTPFLAYFHTTVLTKILCSTNRPWTLLQLALAIPKKDPVAGDIDEGEWVVRRGEPLTCGQY